MGLFPIYFDDYFTRPRLRRSDMTAEMAMITFNLKFSRMRHGYFIPLLLFLVGGCSEQARTLRELASVVHENKVAFKQCDIKALYELRAPQLRDPKEEPDFDRLSAVCKGVEADMPWDLNWRTNPPTKYADYAKSWVLSLSYAEGMTPEIDSRGVKVTYSLSGLHLDGRQKIEFVRLNGKWYRLTP